MYLLAVDKRAYGGSPPISMQLADSPYTISEQIWIVWERLLSSLQRITTFLVSSFLLLASFALLLFVFNEFKLARPGEK
jgi:hypothetical protein